MSDIDPPGETGESRGPFVYRVSWEPNLDDDDGNYKRHYLDRVVEETET